MERFFLYLADFWCEYVGAAAAVGRVKFPRPLLRAHVILLCVDPLWSARWIDPAIQRGPVSYGYLIMKSSINVKVISYNEEREKREHL